MILCDYFCAACNTEQEHMVPSPAPDDIACEFCDERATWQPAPIRGSVATSVARGPVARPESKMFLDTRALGEGQPLHEWKAERRKLYAERRHAERKRGD